MTGPTARRLLGATLLFAASACLSSCTGGDPPGSRGSSTAPTTASATTPTLSTSPTAPASPTLDPRLAATRRAVAAYLNLWKAYETATRSPDPADPSLAEFSADGALANLTGGLKYLKDNGLKSTGVTTHKTTITKVTPLDMPSAVTVSDCLNTSATHIVRVDGKPFKDEPGGKQLTIAEVRLQQAGDWKVSTLAIRGVGTC